MTSPATPQPCNHCKGTGNEPEAGFADSPCDDCNGTGAEVSSPATPQDELDELELALMRQHSQAMSVVGLAGADEIHNATYRGKAAGIEQAYKSVRILKQRRGAASPATPALEQAIQKLADQFSRWGKSKTNTNDSLTEAWSFVAEQLKKALADVARLHTPQARDRWTCTGCPQVVIGCKPTWTHSFTHKHEWVLTP